MERYIDWKNEGTSEIERCLVNIGQSGECGCSFRKVGGDQYRKVSRQPRLWLALGFQREI